MGAIYFFDEALSIQQLTGVYHLGAGYTYSFESPTIDRRDVLHNLSVENRNAVAAALDGFLTQHIMLAFNPSVYEGDSFLDNTPEKNAIRWKSGSVLSADGDDAALKGEYVLTLTCSVFRSEEHTSELQSLMRISYAVFCLTTKKKYNIKL